MSNVDLNLTAVSTQLDYLITRNPKDFETHPVPILQPAQLIAILKSNE